MLERFWAAPGRFLIPSLLPETCKIPPRRISGASCNDLVTSWDTLEASKACLRAALLAFRGLGGARIKGILGRLGAPWECQECDFRNQMEAIILDVIL